MILGVYRVALYQKKKNSYLPCSGSRWDFLESSTSNPLFFQFLPPIPLGYAIEYFTLPSEIFIVISTGDSCSNSCFTDFFYFIKIFMINIYKDQRLEIAFSFMVKCNFEKRHQHLKFSFQTRQEQISIF